MGPASEIHEGCLKGSMYAIVATQGPSVNRGFACLFTPWLHAYKLDVIAAVDDALDENRGNRMSWPPASKE
jgi:hypothetical protein